MPRPMELGDVLLAYSNMNDEWREEIVRLARSKALSKWSSTVEFRSEDLSDLDEDEDEEFSFDDVEPKLLGADGPTDEVLGDWYPGVPDEHMDIAEWFHREWESDIVEIIRNLQSKSRFSNREFVASVLHENSSLGEREAADMMDISVGNFRGKVGEVSNKLRESENTLKVYDKIGGLDSGEESM